MVSNACPVCGAVTERIGYRCPPNIACSLQCAALRDDVLIPAFVALGHAVARFVRRARVDALVRSIREDLVCVGCGDVYHNNNNGWRCDRCRHDDTEGDADVRDPLTELAAMAMGGPDA